MLNSIANFLSRRRDILALLIAIPLSFTFAKLISASGLASGTAFVIFSFLISLIVCFVTDSKTIIVALLSNLLLITFMLLDKYVISGNRFEGWNSETPVILMMLVGIPLIIALLISIPFKMIRNEIRNE